MSFEDDLAAAMRAGAGTLTPPVGALAGEGLRRGRQIRRRRRWAGAGAAVALAAAVTTGAVIAMGSGDRTGTVPAAGACDEALSTGVLPTWARDGFSDPRPRATHVRSEDGRMVAILFGPLTSPSAPDRNNKILWVERPDSSWTDLRIVATLPRTGTTVTRELPGPGPSTVDLPEPGCWTLDLSWGPYRDVMYLEYGRP